MGHKEFGNLIKAKNIISYSLSPFEQRAFAGALSKGVANLFRRFRSQVGYVAPGFVILAAIIHFAEEEHHHSMRKNPKQFENDK